MILLFLLFMNIHDYFSGRKFRGFAVLRFIPRNFSKSFIRESLFPRNKTNSVDRERLFPRKRQFFNLQILYVFDMFFTGGDLVLFDKINFETSIFGIQPKKNTMDIKKRVYTISRVIRNF